MAVKNKSKTPFNEVCDFLVSSEVMRKIYSFTKEGARVIYKLQIASRKEATPFDTKQGP